MVNKNRNNKNLNNSDPGGHKESNDMSLALKKISEKLDEQSELHKTRHEELSAKMEKLILENGVLRARVSALETNKRFMSEEINVLKMKVNDLYQDRIRDNIVVKNVPETEGSEDLLSLFEILAGHIGVQVHKPFIVDSYRLGKRMEGKKRPIVYKLRSNKYKVDIIKAKRKVKIYANTLSIKNMSGEVTPMGSTEDEIYIDEHLTRDNMHLFHGG